MAPVNTIFNSRKHKINWQVFFTSKHQQVWWTSCWCIGSSPVCTQKERVKMIPITAILITKFGEHTDQGPIKSFHEAIWLWSIWTGHMRCMFRSTDSSVINSPINSGAWSEWRYRGTPKWRNTSVTKVSATETVYGLEMQTLPPIRWNNDKLREYRYCHQQSHLGMKECQMWHAPWELQQAAGEDWTCEHLPVYYDADRGHSIGTNEQHLSSSQATKIADEHWHLSVSPLGELHQCLPATQGIPVPMLTSVVHSLASRNTTHLWRSAHSI